MPCMEDCSRCIVLNCHQEDERLYRRLIGDVEVLPVEDERSIVLAMEE